MRMNTLVIVTIGSLCIACGSDDTTADEHDNTHANGLAAEATLAPKSDNTTLAGTASFAGTEGMIQLTVSLTGAPPGEHGVHIHMTGDCSAADGTSAGGHWNPTDQMHGKLGPTAHLGDIGNITVKDDGTGTLTATNALWEIGTGSANDIVGKAMIIHANADDLMSQPTGEAGGRIGCGVIAESE